MAEKEEIATKEENKAAEQPPVVEKKKGSKTIMMMGIVVLISVGCAFVFVSKVYPLLTGNAAADALAPENPENETAVETAEAQTVKQPETKKEPASTSKKKEEKGKEGQGGAEKEESLVVPVDTIVVNLSGSNGRRYLKAKINLEVKDGDVKKIIEAKAVQIKDRLISILSSKTLEDIDGLEAQENLRKEIKDAVDVVLKAEGVLQVYFTEFVVQ
ncbi:MAG: hypothetical protein FJ266_00405 [Planctomycetes bacterium]|nr:hypothetical protein [Planctomycetota bacterium]